MKYLAAFACLLLWVTPLFAQAGSPPSARHPHVEPKPEQIAKRKAEAPLGAQGQAGEPNIPPPELEPATTLDFTPPPSKPPQKPKIQPFVPEQFVEAIRQLGPDLITARLTIDQEILDGLLELLALQPDYRVILAVDHSALSVRYALVHRLLEKLEAYPHVSPRVDIEMYAPISKYHTTWLWDRGLGFTMIRLERLSR